MWPWLLSSCAGQYGRDVAGRVAAGVLMQRTPKVIVAVGLAVILTMVMIPPWTYSYWGVGGRRNLPPGMDGIPEAERSATVYAPIFRPPQLWKARLNVQRLLAQCGGVAALTVLFAWRRRSA